MHMRAKKARRIGIAMIAMLVGAIGASAPARADDSTGSITGRFVDSHGQPITNADVQIWDASAGQTVANSPVDDSGDYTVADLPPGSYFAEFDFSGLTIYSGNTLFLSEAQASTVTAGGVTTIDAQAFPTGVLTGTLTNTDGSPAANIGVGTSSNSFNGNYTSTDDSGNWSVPVFASDYTVSFSLANGLTQYAVGQGDWSTATIYTVGDGQTVTVNDQILPTGTVSGRYTDQDGQPVAGAQVSVNYPDFSGAGFATTDDDGDYQAQVFAGSYNVSFVDADFKTQYAYGALDQPRAATISVTAGGDTVVNDSELPTGTITVTATNGNTGGPIASFCAYSDQESACTKTGTAILTGVRQGEEEVDISPTALKYLYAPGIDVAVTGGQNTNANQVLQPGTTVKTTIVDSTTGLPVADACVIGLIPGFSVWPDGGERCSNKKGVVTIGPLDPGHSYALFATAPYQSTYGDQWVGKDGHGTGMEQNALVIKATPGKTVTIPNIEMDQGGSLSGTVTSAVDGTPIYQAGVGRNPPSAGSGASGDIVETDADGHYTLTNLGPYQWPIFTDAENDAWQWSGDVGNRYQAQTVQVTAGVTTPYDVVMSPGPVLTGTALKADGTPIAEGGYIIVYNAKTGDTMGDTWANPDGSFSIPVTAGQNIRIQYILDEDSTEYNGFFGGTSEATASVVHMPASGKTIHIVLLPGTGE